MRHFGVEVECYGLDIQAASVAASMLFGTYKHEDSSRKYNRATRSAYDSAGREWKFQVEPAVRWTREIEKCEVITPVLETEDLPMLGRLLAELQKLGARSDTEHLCAVHVHVGIEDFSPRELADLVYMMAVYQDDIVADFGVSQERLQRFCRLIPPSFAIRVRREESWTIEDTVSHWQKEEKPKLHLLNILPAAEQGNVEFRLFEFSKGMDLSELRGFVDFSLAMTESAKQGFVTKRYPEWKEMTGYHWGRRV